MPGDATPGPRGTAAAALATIAVILAACGSAPATPLLTATPTAATAAVTAAASAGPPDLFASTYAPERPSSQGGTLVVGDWQEATQLNPYYVGQVTEANVASIAWHSLLTIGSDFRYVPELAAAPIPTTANGGVQTPGATGDAMTVHWRLRDGLRWSDGAPLTCDDFRYAWEWVRDPANAGVITSGFEDIRSIECPSDVDMVWHFARVYEGYLTLMRAPLPRHYLARIPVADQVNGAGFRPGEVTRLPVSGPFAFASVTPQAELRLRRNEFYRNPRSGGPAALDSIAFRWYGDVDALIAGFRAGEVDVALGMQDTDAVKALDLGDAVHLVPALVYEFLRPNWSPARDFDAAAKTGGCSRDRAVATRGPECPMADPAVREAIAFAIDKDEINARLLGASAQVANSNVPPAEWFYADQPPTRFDPTRARAILAGAGWTDTDGDGFVEKGGTTARIELCTTTRQLRQDTLALVSGWLKAVGIDSVIHPVSPSDIFADYNEATLDTPCALSTSNFDLAEHAFSSSIDPLDNYFSYHSSQFLPHGANAARIADRDVDASLDAVKESVDFGVVRDAMAAFQAAFAARIVEIPLYYRKNLELAAPAVGNYEANGTQSGSTWNAEDWFLRP